MLQAALRYWCLVLLCSMMSSSAFYLPHLSTRVPSLQHIARVLERDEHHAHIVKRSSFRSFGALSRVIARHSRRLSERAAVHKLFSLFDMNKDNVIEQDEFRATLKILGIIRHRY